MQLLFVLLLSHLRYLDLLNLSPQLLHAAVPVDAIGNVISKAVPQHALAVGFTHAIRFAQPAEGVAAAVGCVVAVLTLQLSINSGYGRAVGKRPVFSG